MRVTVADTVPAGGVAVTKLEQFGPEPLQVAATGVVGAPATRGGGGDGHHREDPGHQGHGHGARCRRHRSASAATRGAVEELPGASVSPPWSPRASSRIERIEPSLP